MKNHAILTHRGYLGSYEADFESQSLHGRVLGVRDVIHYEGQNPAELQQAFRDSVDDYLEWCEQEGEEPDKAFSGKLNLRLGEDVHRAAANAADALGISLNDFVKSAVQREVQEAALCGDGPTRPARKAKSM